MTGRDAIGSDEELGWLSACDLRDQYATGSLSPVEVLEAVLGAIDAWDARLHAFVTVCDEAAHESARRAAAEMQKDAEWPETRPLLGIPVSIKDVIATAGIRTTMGSMLWQDSVPSFDPPVVERLRAAGAVIVGKTNTSEFGWKADSGNRLIGPTLNPWDLSCTAGGSSGGAAASVAAGLGPLAIGTDGAGSVRIPAAFCGVVGFKPSAGRIPYHPASSVGQLAHLGIISRTVEDLLLTLAVVAGPDRRDAGSIDGRFDPAALSQFVVDELRLGVSSDFGAVALEPHVRGVYDAAVTVTEALLGSVDSLTPTWTDPYPMLDRICAAGHAARHRDDFEAVKEFLDPGLIPVIESGISLSGVDVAEAHHSVRTFAESVNPLFDEFDVLVTPTLPITAFRAGLDQPGEVAGVATSYLDWTPFTYPFNVTGFPALSLPCGLAENGLPVGLQIVGPWRRDDLVLAVGRALAAALPWESRQPDHLATGFKRK